MGILSSVQKTGTGPQAGIRAVIAGREKMGKTTMLASAPKPLFIPLEEGTAAVMGVDKTQKITCFENLMLLMKELKDAKGAGYKSLCFDGAVGIETLIHDYVIRMDKGSKTDKSLSMESSHGGYGKAYAVALQEFQAFTAMCDVFANNGINIILASHVFASKMIDPTVGEYDSWDLLLHSPKNNKNYGKREHLTQWADIIGFLYEPFMVSKTNNVTMGISQNKGRVLAVSRTPQYTAGNRFGLEGEFPIGKDDSWNYLAWEIKQASGGRLDYMNQ